MAMLLLNASESTLTREVNTLAAWIGTQGLARAHAQTSECTTWKTRWLHCDINRWLNLSLKSSKVELRCLRKGSVSYGLGADFSLPHCLVGDRVSESNLEPSPAGISDLRAEISWCIVMVRRSGKASRRYRCQLYFFSRQFQLFCSLFFFVLNMPCGRHSDCI